MVKEKRTPSHPWLRMLLSGDKHGLLKWIGEKLNELCGLKKQTCRNSSCLSRKKHAEASSTSSHKKVFETLKDSGFDAVTLEFSRELCNRLLQQQQTKGEKRERREEKDVDENRNGRVYRRRRRRRASTLS